MKHLQNAGFLEDEHKKIYAKYRGGGDKMMLDCINVEYEAIVDTSDTRTFAIFCPSQCGCTKYAGDTTYLGQRYGFHSAHAKLVDHMYGDFTTHPMILDSKFMKELAREPGKWIFEVHEGVSLPPGGSSQQPPKTETICFSNICRSASIDQIVDFLHLEGYDEPEKFRLFYSKGKVFGFADLSGASDAVQKLKKRKLGGRFPSVYLAEQNAA